MENHIKQVLKGLQELILEQSKALAHEQDGPIYDTGLSKAKISDLQSRIQWLRVIRTQFEVLASKILV